MGRIATNVQKPQKMLELGNCHLEVKDMENNAEKETAEKKTSDVQESAQHQRQQAGEYDRTQIALEASILGALLGVAVFLQSVTGMGATVGKALGFLVFVLGMLTFPSWKGKTHLGVFITGASGGIVYGVLSALF